MLNFLKKKIAYNSTKFPDSEITVPSTTNLIETLNLSRGEPSVEMEVNVFSVVIKAW